MKDYSQYYKKSPSLQERGIERVFQAHYQSSIEGFDIVVDEKYEKQALIQKHSNPINSHLEDKLMTVLVKDKEGLKWGSYIDCKEDRRYLVLTYPETTDGVTLKTKIRKITDTCLFIFEDGSKHAYDCIDTNYLLYDDKTYTTDTKIFEEDERKAVVVPYNEVTSTLRMIDDVILDKKEYKIIKKEEITETVDGEKQGVIQLVLIRTAFGKVFCNGEPLRAIVRFARMKDKVLNSKSRELITDHNVVKSGDYIKHEYVRDEEGNLETKNYIVRSLVDMRIDYDITYILNCDAEFYMWDAEKQDRVLIPCYVEDNRTRFEDADNTYIKLEDSQFQIIVQENELTKKLGKEVDRILLKGEAYSIVDTDNLSLENAIYVGLSSSRIDTNKDNLELGIADYYKLDIKEPQVTPLDIIGETHIVIGCQYVYAVDYTEQAYWLVDREDIIDLEYLDNSKINLIVKEDINIIGETVTLTCEIGGVKITKELLITSW